MFNTARDTKHRSNIHKHVGKPYFKDSSIETRRLGKLSQLFQRLLQVIIIALHKKAWATLPEPDPSMMAGEDMAAT
jgi:hypothetical protein